MKNVKGILVRGEDGDFLVTFSLVAVPFNKELFNATEKKQIKTYFDKLKVPDAESMVKMAQERGTIVGVWDGNYFFKVLNEKLWDEIKKDWQYMMDDP